MNCRLLEIEEPQRRRWTWVVGGIDTVVSFTLTQAASGRQLPMHRSGFKPDQKQDFGGARYGRKMMGEKLIELLARIP